MEEGQSDLAKGLLETLQRTEASLLPAVEEHFSNDDFKASQGLDFLDVKNSILLSYLIELTHDLRNRLMGEEQQAASLERLNMMKTVIDKSRGLDKKLRYQIDKLLAAGSTASTFAAGSENMEEDPLQFRPDLDAMDEDDNPEKDDEDSSFANNNSEENEDSDDSGEDEDEELAAARMTVEKSREKKNGKKKKKTTMDEDDEGSEDDKNGGVYRAPRLTAVPYTHDKNDKEEERERRQRRRLRASELAQTLRAQYGDAPEQEDTHGGAELGRQREAARRMAEREKEKTRFEEDNMIRLTVSRKEKKDRKRLMRQENSNLSAIADMGNLVRESRYGEKRKGREQNADVFESKRHSNGKRIKQLVDGDGRRQAKKGRKSLDAKNSLQAELFGSDATGGKKKSKKRKG